MKRSRRGGRRPQGTHNGHSGGSSGGGGNNYNPNRTFDSNGPEIKVRGSASHVYEKYLQMARDANTQGDRVMAENYLQHAEHYFRIMSAAQAQQQQALQAQQQQANSHANGNRLPQPNGSGEQPYIGNGQQPGPSFSLTDANSEEEDESDEATAE